MGMRFVFVCARVLRVMLSLKLLIFLWHHVGIFTAGQFPKIVGGISRGFGNPSGDRRTLFGA